MHIIFLNELILCWCFKDNTFVVNFLSWQISDAYHWMEDPDSEETKAFVEAQNNISRPFLDSCPVRDKLNKRYINMQQLTTWLTKSLNSPPLIVEYYSQYSWFCCPNCPESLWPMCNNYDQVTTCNRYRYLQ